jgi:hypothetical protein
MPLSQTEQAELLDHLRNYREADRLALVELDQMLARMEMHYDISKKGVPMKAGK